jgi:hypothetical protein
VILQIVVVPYFDFHCDLFYGDFGLLKLKHLIPNSKYLTLKE